MERAAFLSSLPFLIPLHSTAWPPIAGGSGSSSTLLLGDSYDNRTFVLSLEALCEKADATTRSRPLFFKPSRGLNDRSSSDPSLAPIQLVVVDQSGEGSSAVYLRVDGYVYALDLRQLKKLEVVPESFDTDMDDDDETSYRRRKVSRPCSLVLQFEGVLLRIFRNNLEVCREDKETLTAVCLTFSALENIFFTISPDDIASPSRLSTCGSSGSTTVDVGEQNDSAVLLGFTPPTPVASAVGNKRSADSSNSDPTTRIQRHRTAFHESLSSLVTVRHVLDMPESAIAGDCSNNDDDGDNHHGENASSSLSLSPLLNRTAHLTSQSFISASEMTAVDEHYETLLQRIQQEMERTLSSFFPAPHRGGRGRYNSKNDKQQQPKVSGASAAQAFLDLVEQQNRIVEERHKLLLLPTRG